MNPTLISPPGHLHRVRAQTCYWALRFLANVVAVVGFIVALLLIPIATHLLVTGAAASFVPSDAKTSNFLAGPLPGLVLGAVGVMFGLLTELARQCVILLADLADLSIAATILATRRQGDVMPATAHIPSPPAAH